MLPASTKQRNAQLRWAYLNGDYVSPAGKRVAPATQSAVPAAAGGPLTLESFDRAVRQMYVRPYIPILETYSYATNTMFEDLTMPTDPRHYCVDAVEASERQRLVEGWAVINVEHSGGMGMPSDRWCTQGSLGTYVPIRRDPALPPRTVRMHYRRVDPAGCRQVITA